MGAERKNGYLIILDGGAAVGVGDFVVTMAASVAVIEGLAAYFVNFLALGRSLGLCLLGGSLRCSLCSGLCLGLRCCSGSSFCLDTRNLGFFGGNGGVCAFLILAQVSS